MNTRHLLACLLLTAAGSLRAQPSPQANAAFNRYTTLVEQRLARQHAAPDPFAPGTVTPEREAQLGTGTPLIEQVAEPQANSAAPGAMLHHWRGTAFLPHTRAADFEAMLRNFSAYPRHFAPEVQRATLNKPPGDEDDITLRVRQKHILTVVLDATYLVSFGHIGPGAGYEISRSQNIQEIADTGTPHEHLLAAADAHGFLWRLDTYWTWAEHDGGLIVQVESVSLSRAIPAGLGWAVRPFVESVPRESLAFTLHSASIAVKSSETHP